MCCGSRRSAWRAAQAPTAPAPPPAQRARSQMAPAVSAGSQSATAQGPFPEVVVRYGEASPMRVRGPVTGRAYAFSVDQPSQAMDVRDAATLLRNRAFSRAASSE